MFFTALVHPLIVKMATSRNMFDNPDKRKLQSRPIPVMGGLAVFFGIVVGAGATSVFFNSYALFTCVITLTVMMYVGMLDDMVGLSPVARLIVELFLVAFVVYMDKTNINDLHGVFGIGKLPVWVSLPLCSVSCLGIINSINLIDGVDGLSSGLCIFACMCFGVVFCSSYDGTMGVMASLAAGALVPFFFHNVFGAKSKMFVGDSGTLMLGMLMSIFCMRMIDNTSLVQDHHPKMGVIAFCLSVLSVPVFDTLRVMFGRIVKGVSPFHPDKSHLHHLFIEIGFSHIGTTVAILCINTVNVACWLISFLLGFGPTGQFLVVFILGAVNTVGFYYTVRLMNHQRIPYRCLKWLAVKSHKETGKTFLAIRSLMDKI
ncbi:MAG TPA: undecaprenyl-phosphate alpha-N-acetylglucosaminyl 1-phosphate transferase [Prevotella sp.]|nr:undecaprenyl-phosphate alpha-N-acetylglucosaminyl 1-phosphate transferase [Prevotella sp.]